MAPSRECGPRGHSRRWMSDLPSVGIPWAVACEGRRIPWLNKTTSVQVARIPISGGARILLRHLALLPRVAHGKDSPEGLRVLEDLASLRHRGDSLRAHLRRHIVAQPIRDRPRPSALSQPAAGSPRIPPLRVTCPRCPATCPRWRVGPPEVSRLRKRAGAVRQLLRSSCSSWAWPCWARRLASI